MALGDKVKALRARKGWNQRELAQHAHVRQALLLGAAGDWQATPIPPAPCCAAWLAGWAARSII